MISRPLRVQQQEAQADLVEMPFEYSHWDFIKSTLTPLVNGTPSKKQVLLAIGAILSERKNDLSGATTTSLDQFSENSSSVLCLSHALDLFEEQYYPDDYNSEKSFIRTVIPFVANLVLDTEKYVPSKSLKYLKMGMMDTVEVSKVGAACLLANSFFCTWKRISNDALWEVFPSINYDEMFCEHPNYRPQLAKCLMLLNYFARIHESFALICQNPNLKIKFSRVCLSVNDIPDFANSSLPLTEIEVHSEGSISDSKDALQMDFANKYIGGASISFGCVQEEIEFSLCPEMNVARLICQVMQDNESILITGAEQFSSHKGYAFTLDYGGNYMDTNKDSNGNSLKETSAIDALVFNRITAHSQWQKSNIDREIIKAYAGFCHSSRQKISTGCGAFLGDKELKSLIQTVAAAQARKDLIYYTFKTQALDDHLANLVNSMRKKGVTVGQLYQALCSIISTASSSSNSLPETFKAVKGILRL
ncbi:hypothetical protein C9374_001532 [Naegleria lovaniensis]|uniref:poly(ADP-ribose) glycohydrolase n=1 Tax=Naegleria lovaniensis TaxID=51637 RepID=A0AA88GQU4_NAELO|nr:uncharacterized protein C9374_001532 [Naegleria lovaniensis]KAG2387200.1 hypothetical protein C9374_001532 [Naegleria lovaniensis]